MHIQCTICSDLVNPAESLYVTKCGHIFHHHCLVQWIERSKSCPQCRHKVTERCMFRLFPTVSEGSREDAAALQARLDHAALQLRTQAAQLRQLEERLAAASADLNNKESLVAAAEKRLVAQECALAALRQQLAHARERAGDAEQLQQDNRQLQQTLHTLNGLQRVLHATAGEVEATLRDYSDPRTVATFAAALKRALCESESKKRAWRARQLQAARELAALRDQHRQLEAKLLKREKEYESLKHKKRKFEEVDPRAAKQPRASPPSPRSATASPPTPRAAGASPPSPRPAAESPPAAAADTPPAHPRLDDAVISEDNISFSSLVDRIVQSQSPYLSLQRSGLALCTLRRRAPQANLKPSELAVLSSSATSIFRQKDAAAAGAGGAAAGAGGAAAAAGAGGAYDGLGGRARPDEFPRPAPRLAPRLTARHRLRAPAPRAPPAGCRDIAAMFRRRDDPPDA